MRKCREDKRAQAEARNAAYQKKLSEQVDDITDSVVE
jgi:hypothetical protein